MVYYSWEHNFGKSPVVYASSAVSAPRDPELQKPVIYSLSATSHNWSALNQQDTTMIYYQLPNCRIETDKESLFLMIAEEIHDKEIR